MKPSERQQDKHTERAHSTGADDDAPGIRLVAVAKRFATIDAVRAWR